MMGGMGMLKPEFIADAVIVSEEQKEHPNFIAVSYTHLDVYTRQS